MTLIKLNHLRKSSLSNMTQQYSQNIFRFSLIYLPNTRKSINFIIYGISPIPRIMKLCLVDGHITVILHWSYSSLYFINVFPHSQSSFFCITINNINNSYTSLLYNIFCCFKTESHLEIIIKKNENMFTNLEPVS